ncbi:hypothetical protein LJR230_004481 [Trinickia sp. LjRoot230]|uniref:hypothetical protein n=1 Tax=Trinickia sp. LjRoot230 TaxID=3342288 RepID=UPI003ECC5357
MLEPIGQSGATDSSETRDRSAPLDRKTAPSPTRQSSPLLEWSLDPARHIRPPAQALSVALRRPAKLTLADVTDAQHAAISAYGSCIARERIPAADCWMILPGRDFEALAREMYRRYDGPSQPEQDVSEMDGASFLSGSPLTGSRPLILLRETPFNRVTSVPLHELLHCLGTLAFWQAIQALQRWLPVDLMEGITEYLNWRVSGVGKPIGVEFPFQEHAKRSGGLNTYTKAGIVAERIAHEIGAPMLASAYLADGADDAIDRLRQTVNILVEDGDLFDLID